MTTSANEVIARKLREAAAELEGGAEVTDHYWVQAEPPEQMVTKCADCLTEQVCEKDALGIWVCYDYAACRQRMANNIALRPGDAITVMQDAQLPVELQPWSKKGAEGALCHLCPLASKSCAPTYVPPELDRSKFIPLLVGEAPGANEAIQHRPFVGKSGQLLQEVWNRAGGDFENAIRTNVVLCQPPENRQPTETEVRCCRPRLERELAELPYNRIVTLGKTATVNVREMIGKPQQHRGAERGIWVKWDKRDVWLIPTWHPAFILRSPGNMNEFIRDLIRAVAGPAPDPIAAALAEEPEVTVIETKKQLAEVFASIPDNSWVAFDLETDQLVWYDRPEFKVGSTKDRPAQRADPILCMAFTDGVGYGYIIPDYILYDCPGAKEMITDFFKRIRTVSHNGKFDLLFSAYIGIQVHLSVDPGAFDTMLAHYALDENPGTHGLKELAQEYFSIVNYEELLIKKYLTSVNDRYSKIPEEPLYKYAVWDVCSTLALAIRFKAEMQRQGIFDWPFQNLFMPAIKTVANMEWRGIKIDRPYLMEWRGTLLKKADILQEQMREIAGSKTFNPGSHLQLKKLLYEQLGLPRPHAARGGTGVISKEGATSKVSLKQIAGMHPILDMIAEYRTVKKIVSSYIDNLLNYAGTDDCVHTQYFIHGTETGRMSARNPPLQTIPRGSNIYGKIIKSAFIPRPGKVFVDADYKSAELRVFAAETRDPFLWQVYEDGRDLHTEVTIAMFGTEDSMTSYEWKYRRNLCKMFNFAWVYGGGESSFGDAIPDRAKAVEFVREYERQMPTARAWRENQGQIARQRGYVQTRTGRRRRFPFITGDNWEEVRKAAINQPIQGGASDMTTLSGIRLDTEGYDVLLFVHDSIVTEVDEDRAEEGRAYIQQVMVETAMQWYPEVKWAADSDIAERWADIPSEADLKALLESVASSDEQVDV